MMSSRSCMASIVIFATIGAYASALAQQIQAPPTRPFAAPQLQRKLPTQKQPTPREMRRPSAAQLLITTGNVLPPASRGNLYRQALTASGGTAPYAWSVTRGRLPAGLILSPAGVLSGIPTASGRFSFTLKLTDSRRVATTKVLALSVTMQAATVTPAKRTTPQPAIGSTGAQTIVSGSLTVNVGTLRFVGPAASSSFTPAQVNTGALVFHGSASTAAFAPVIADVGMLRFIGPVSSAPFTPLDLTTESLLFIGKP